MLHEMKLNEGPFLNIKKGVKKIELRLYDEKRQGINLNDIIRFSKQPDLNEYFDVKVTGLLRYNTFEAMFKDVDYNICGPADSLSLMLDNMRKIYAFEEENKYGVIGIHVELI